MARSREADVELFHALVQLSKRGSLYWIRNIQSLELGEVVHVDAFVDKLQMSVARQKN